jgi:hypothetical protein
MRRRLAMVGAGSLAWLALSQPAPAWDQSTRVDDLLPVIGRYLDQYQNDIASIVANEAYIQRRAASSIDGRTRTLKSDVLAVNHDAVGWVVFRDVYEVDGKPVRERAERITTLFTGSAPGALAQARRIAEESARFNLNPPGVQLSRTVNTPFMALRFLVASNQPRSIFRLDGTRSVGGRRVPVIRFRERHTPRIIQSIDDGAAMGACAVDPETGRILWTELSLETTDTRPSPTVTISLTIRVTYAEQRALGLWLPARMEESYEVRAGSTAGDLTGEATYSNYRKFSVATIVK